MCSKNVNNITSNQKQKLQMKKTFHQTMQRQGEANTGTQHTHRHMHTNQK